MTGMDGRHTVSAHPLDQCLAWIVRVDCAEFGLYRTGTLDLLLIVRLVQEPAQTDRRASIDQSGSHHRGVYRANPSRYLNFAGWSYTANLALLDDYYGVREGPASGRVDSRSRHGNLSQSGTG